MLRPIRVYADTSVFGGVFDEGFEKASRVFFDQVRERQFELVVSALVQEEIEEAPPRVHQFFDSVADPREIIPVSAAALDLQEAYLEAGIVGIARQADALHVALAAVSACVCIVSWNFRHIVHFEKIPMYNAISSARGYRPLGIFSPPEVIRYEEEGV